MRLSGKGGGVRGKGEKGVMMVELVVNGGRGGGVSGEEGGGGVCE